MPTQIQLKTVKTVEIGPESAYRTAADAPDHTASVAPLRRVYGGASCQPAGGAELAAAASWTAGSLGSGSATPPVPGGGPSGREHGAVKPCDTGTATASATAKVMWRCIAQKAALALSARAASRGGHA